MVAAGVVGTSYGEKFFVCKAREWLVGDRECGAGGVGCGEREDEVYMRAVCEGASAEEDPQRVEQCMPPSECGTREVATRPGIGERASTAALSPRVRPIRHDVSLRQPYASLLLVLSAPAVSSVCRPHTMLYPPNSQTPAISTLRGPIQ